MEILGNILLLIALFVFVIVFGTALVLEFFGKVITQAPFVPAPRKVAKRIGELVSLKEGEVFYDLGSGEGQVVRSVAHSNPLARVIGVEKAPLPRLLAHLFTPRKKYPNVTYHSHDLRSVSLSDADCVFLYLLPNLMNVLGPKLKKELKTGALILTCDFTLPDWEPINIERLACGNAIYKINTYQKT